MRKENLLLVLFLCFGFALQAQKVPNKMELKKEKSRVFSKGTMLRPLASCGVLNDFPLDDNERKIWIWNETDGFLAGSNWYEDQENAGLFIAPQNMPYLGEIYFYFGAANSNIPANLSKTINFKIYDLDAYNRPNNVIKTVSRTLQELKIDVDNDDLTIIIFDEPVNLPENRKFGVSVDFSSLIWDHPSVMDSLSLWGWFVSEQDEFCMVKESDGYWSYYSDYFGDEGLDLAIFAVVGDEASCFDIVPVQLSSFTVKSGTGQVDISWITETEQNSDLFFIQRSSDGVNFMEIASVGSKAPSGNSTSPLHYSFVDRNPIQGINYYRLVQRDKDGSTYYSKIQSVNIKVAVNLARINIYPNPVSNTLKIQFNSTVTSAATLQILDITGRNLKTETFKLSAGENVLNMNVGELQKGNYLLKITLPGEKSRTLKFVK